MMVHITCGKSQGEDEGCGQKILWSLCNKNQIQEMQREGAKAGLEVQAKRMRTFSDFKHPKAESGCTVRIKVPDVDRARTDG